MIWSLLAAAAPSIVSGIGQLFNKPKKSDYDQTPDTSYMDKYISSMRGRQSSREVYHMAMQPALRAIGQQQSKTQRQIGYGVERAGLTGSGIEAQQRLSAGQMGLEAIQRAGESATQAQMTESRRLGQQVDEATMKRGQMISEGKKASEQAYERAQTQWRQNLVSTAAQGVGAVASAGFSQIAATKKLEAEKAKAATAAYEASMAAGHFEGTGAEFTAKAQAAGYTDPAMYAESLKTAATPTKATVALGKHRTAVQNKMEQSGIWGTAEAIVKEKYGTLEKFYAGGGDIDMLKAEVEQQITTGETKKGIGETFSTGFAGLTSAAQSFKISDSGTAMIPDIEKLKTEAVKAGGWTDETRRLVDAKIQHLVNEIPEAELKANTMVTWGTGKDKTTISLGQSPRHTLATKLQKIYHDIPTIGAQPEEEEQQSISQKYGGVKKQPGTLVKKTIPSKPYAGDPEYEREPPGYSKKQLYEPTPPSETAQRYKQAMVDPATERYMDAQKGQPLISRHDELMEHSRRKTKLKEDVPGGIPGTKDAYQQTLRAMADKKDIAERYKQATVDPATQRYMDAQKETKKLPPTTEEYQELIKQRLGSGTMGGDVQGEYDRYQRKLTAERIARKHDSMQPTGGKLVEQITGRKHKKAKPDVMKGFVGEEAVFGKKKTKEYQSFSKRAKQEAKKKFGKEEGVRQSKEAATKKAKAKEQYLKETTPVVGQKYTITKKSGRTKEITPVRVEGNHMIYLSKTGKEKKYPMNLWRKDLKAGRIK